MSDLPKYDARLILENIPMKELPWIAVESSLPHPSMRVVAVYDLGGMAIDNTIEKEDYFDCMNYTVKWKSEKDEIEEYGDCDAWVTHWCPLELFLEAFCKKVSESKCSEDYIRISTH